MKKAIFTLLFMATALGAVAQMQVWSNGTIIFSHNANDVDSISFAGSPMHVQANTQESITSLAGAIYSANLSGEGSNKTEITYLFFLDGTTGYFSHQGSIPSPGSLGNGSINYTVEFTYVINGNDIQLTCESSSVGTINGKIIGRDGLVFFNWSTFNSSPRSAAFVSVLH